MHLLVRDARNVLDELDAYCLLCFFLPWDGLKPSPLLLWPLLAYCIAPDDNGCDE
jgi:hypothetical protein